MLTQNHWIYTLKSGCNFCHQLGNQLTRTLDHVSKADPEVKTPMEAWDRRLKGGCAATRCTGHSARGLPGTLEDACGLDRSHRKGEVPQAPPRPAAWSATSS